MTSLHSGDFGVCQRREVRRVQGSYWGVARLFDAILDAEQHTEQETAILVLPGTEELKKD